MGFPHPTPEPGPATTVTGPDAYGAAAAVGASTLYAREDHDHGMLAAPVGSTPALGVNPPVSGTVYQNTSGVALHLKIPITATAIGGSAQLALGAASPPPAFGGAEQIGVAAEVHNVDLTVPVGWYWSVTVVSATIGTASVLGL